MSRIRPRLRAIRRQARNLMQDRPAGRRSGSAPETPTDARVYQVLELCLRVGDALLSSGEAAADVTSSMTRLAAACGLRSIEIDVTFTSITLCCRRGRDITPVTSMRVVRTRSTDLSRLAEVSGIVDQVVRRNLGVVEADAALTEVVDAPHPYPRWLATVAWGGLAAAVALLFGGGPLIWLIAFVVTAVIDRVGRLLSHLDVAPFFVQLAGGLIATLSTVTLLGLGVFPSSVQPSLVIAASITVLLSGLSLVNAVQDAISGHPVTAAGRIIEVALLSAGLLTGVILGLKAGLAFGLTLDPAQIQAVEASRFGVSVLAAVIVAATYAVASYAPLPSLAAAAVSGGIGWAAYGALTLLAHWGPVVSAGLAAAVIGVASELFGSNTRSERHVVVLAGIIPLLPGLTAYRGFYQLASTQVVDGLITVTLALAIGLALAAGVTFGQFSVRRLAAGRTG